MRNISHQRYQKQANTLLEKKSTNLYFRNAVMKIFNKLLANLIQQHSRKDFGQVEFIQECKGCATFDNR